MNSLILVLGMLAAAMSGMTMLALRRARQVGERCADLELQIADADQRLGEVAMQVSHLMKSGKQTAGRVDRLSADQGRLASVTRGVGCGEAIALIQQGASAEQLIKTCGISGAEARLVERLYGKKQTDGEPGSASFPESANKFILVDAHLNAADRRPER